MQLLVFRVETELRVEPVQLRDGLMASATPADRLEHSYWRREPGGWVAALWVSGDRDHLTGACRALIGRTLAALGGGAAFVIHEDEGRRP